jgi:hypothetical protein
VELKAGYKSTEEKEYAISPKITGMYGGLEKKMHYIDAFCPQHPNFKKGKK